MKLFFSIMFFLVGVLAFAQAPLNFSSRMNVTGVSGSDPYTINGVLQDELGKWSAADINATADSIYHLEGSDLLIYRIVSITSVSGNNFTLVVDDITNSGILPSTGNEWAVMEFTTNHQYPIYIGNLSSPFKAVIDNRFKQRLDEKTGIDTSFIENDSIFLVSQEDTIFTGLADAPRPNNGRIWYVSKSGNNIGCVVGDPTRPCFDMWAVADSVVTGDVVWITTGVWTIGSVGSGANREMATTTSANLWRNGKDSITWYYQPGATIKVISAFNYALHKLDAATSNNYFKVAGNGTFIFGTTGGRIFNTINSTSNKLNYEIEADAVYNSNFNDALHNFDNISIRYKNFTATSSATTANWQGFGVGTNNATCTGCIEGGNYSLSIENMTVDLARSDWAVTSTFVIYAVKKKNISIKVNNFYSLEKQSSIFLKDRDFSIDSTCINIDIGILRAIDPLLNSSYYAYDISENYTNETSRNGSATSTYISAASTGNLINIFSQLGPSSANVINVKIGSGYTDIPVTGNIHPGFVVNLDIGNLQTRANNPIIAGASVLTNSGIVNVNCSYCQSRGSVFVETTKYPIFNLSGYYKTTNASTPVVAYKAGSLTTNYSALYNAILVAPSGTAVIAPFTPANARSYIINNSATNSTVISSDVTELVTPIIRNSNIR